MTKTLQEFSKREQKRGRFVVPFSAERSTTKKSTRSKVGPPPPITKVFEVTVPPGEHPIRLIIECEGHGGAIETVSVRAALCGKDDDWPSPTSPSA